MSFVAEFLIDSSALWRIQRDATLRRRWTSPIDDGFVRSCAPQRAEFKRSARSVAEFDMWSQMFADYYPDVAVPKTAWRWIDAFQHRLAAEGAIGAFSMVDLLLCATAAHQGLIVLHDDRDFETASRLLADVRQHRI